MARGCTATMKGGSMLANERRDREEAYDRTDRYFELQGEEIPPYDSSEYRDVFYYQLDKIERGE